MTPQQILWVVTAYAALLYAVAWWGARRSDNATFFTGGRRMAWWVVALGMIGAPMSGVSFVSVPGSVAGDAFSYLQMVLGFTAGQLVIAFVLVPLFYRLRITSLYEYLELRFGVELHRMGALMFLLSKLLLSALKLLVVCLVMQQLVCTPLAIPFGVNVLLSTALVWGFTQRGGVRSVVRIDLLQTACLVGAVVASIWAIISHFEWSISTLFEVLSEDPRSQIFFPAEPLSTRSFGKMFIGGLFMLIAMTGLDQDLMQRNLSCPTARDSQRNILLTALMQGVVIWLLLILGVLLYRYAETVGITASGDDLFAAVALNGGLHTGVGILFVLGLVSSTWATSGSALTALTTSAIYDLAPEHWRSDAQRLRTLRRRLHALLALALGGLVLLFAYGTSDSLIHLLYGVASYIYGPILGLFAFGLLTRRRLPERRPIWVCVASPLLAYALKQLLLNHADYAIGYELILYNALLCFGGLYLISKRP